LEGILADLRLLKQYDEISFFIERLKLINTTVQGLNRTVPYSALYYSLLIDVDQGRYTDAATQLQSHLVTYPDFERGLAQLARPVRADFELLLVRLDIGLGNLSAALHRLNRVQAGPVRSLPDTLVTQIRLMNLLLHARLGNADYLNYALRSAERKFKASDNALAGNDSL
jgi:hypothetical protein